VAMLLIGIPLLTSKVDVLTALRWWVHSTQAVVLWILKL